MKGLAETVWSCLGFPEEIIKPMYDHSTPIDLAALGFDPVKNSSPGAKPKWRIVGSW
jgi:hypothetical protein